LKKESSLIKGSTVGLEASKSLFLWALKKANVGFEENFEA
jgi:hypothetical protein